MAGRSLQSLEWDRHHPMEPGTQRARGIPFPSTKEENISSTTLDKFLEVKPSEPLRAGRGGRT